MMIDDIGERAVDDALRLLIGEGIAKGEYRKVYHCAMDAEAVVKVEYKPATFANVAEWDLWQNLRDTKWGKWFAPALQISPCGLVLLMKKVTPLESRPAFVPSFLADLKRENWGMLEGRPVVCDYGNNAIFKLVSSAATMQRPNWNDLK